MRTYTQIQTAKMKFQSSRGRTDIEPDYNAEWTYLCENLGFENYTTRVHRFVAFRMGGKFGLYPTPTQNVNIMLNCHIWLPLLEEDDDTNFFLEYGYDVVMAIATKKMSLYMKEDDRFDITEKELEVAVSTLIQWDSQVHEDSNTSYAT